MTKKGYQAKKRFGQNFLHDDAILQSMIRAINPTKTDTVLEIGPGLGALTVCLQPRVKVLDLIEIDRDLCQRLRQTMGHCDNVTLHEQDVLMVNFADFLSASSQKTKVVGNLPYNIATEIIIRLSRLENQVESMHFLVQKEVAERLCASPKTKAYGRLTIMVGLFCEAIMLFDVPPTAFSPQPKVQSCFIRLTPHDQPKYEVVDMAHFSMLIRHAFNQRRKKIANSLKGVADENALQQAHIDPLCRPEEISIQHYVSLSNAIVS